MVGMVFNSDGTPVNERIYLLEIKKLEGRLNLYAGYIDHLIAGDTFLLPSITQALEADGFWDENQEWVCDDEG